jgi:hypothetical protein
MTNPHLKRKRRRPLKNLLFSDAERFCNHLIWPKMSKFLILLFAAGKRNTAENSSKGGISYRTTGNTEEYGAKRRVEQEGYLRNQHTRGPARYLISLIGMKHSGLW